ncbi:MAG: UDP-N-acetylglucosamine 2-epimerase (non-hydrolyzing) [Balneolaceae bacterium]
MKRICYVLGTRPEAIKLMPVIEAVASYGANNIRQLVINTCQQKDLVDKLHFGVDQDRMDIPNKSLAEFSSAATVCIQNWLKDDKPDIVVIQGDTSSAFAGAMAAFFNKIPVAHVEAGLRTWDINDPYPEEFYRQAISSIADLHFCPTREAAENLSGDNGEKIVTGNTVVDRIIGNDAKERRLVAGNKVLITLHRRENYGKVAEYLKSIEAAAAEYKDFEFILLAHPNPNINKHYSICKNIQVIDPVDHETFLDLLAEARCVITDSGGVQEEATIMGKRCLICRDQTERPETIDEGLGMICTVLHTDIMYQFAWALEDYKPAVNFAFGEGIAGKKIARHIVDFLKTDTTNGR